MRSILRLTVCALFSALCLRPAQPEFLNERHVYRRGETAALRIRVAAAAGRVAVDTSGWLPETLSVRNGEALYRLDTGLLRSKGEMMRGRGTPGGAAIASPTPDLAACFKEELCECRSNPSPFSGRQCHDTGTPPARRFEERGTRRHFHRRRPQLQGRGALASAQPSNSYHCRRLLSEVIQHRAIGPHGYA